MKTALVLSGGGARGAYEVGVWKALEKLNIHCDIVTGVSIGSINAAMYAQQDLSSAESIWKKINYKMVFETDNEPINNKETVKKYLYSARHGGLEPTNLKNNLINKINVEKVYNSYIDYGLITVKYPKIKEVSLTKNEINKEQFIDYLIASSTVYPVFKLKEIENSNYIDGGFKNSIPLELAKKMGAEKLIVVNISVFSKNKKINEDENTIVIKPRNDLGQPLFFNSRQSRKNLKYGYNDTMKKFKKLYGKKYTFKDLDKYYEKDKYINTFDKFINTIEYLGKCFNIDDTKIYTIDKYNQLIYNEISKIKIKKNIRKDLLSNKERIIITYQKLINERRTYRRKRVLNREFRASYYLFKVKKQTSVF